MWTEEAKSHSKLFSSSFPFRCVNVHSAMLIFSLCLSLLFLKHWKVQLPSTNSDGAWNERGWVLKLKLARFRAHIHLLSKLCNIWGHYSNPLNHYVMQSGWELRWGHLLGKRILLLDCKVQCIWSIHKISYSQPEVQYGKTVVCVH